MVEMIEAKNALVGATDKSLVLFDELGRGTATFDGMSLARAILEYISEKVKCKTLFSTHYHELTDLDKRIPSIKNVHVEAREEDGNVVFLHKIMDGAVDKSYGIHVAKLAGLPDEVLQNARAILNIYEDNSKKKRNDTHIEQIAMDFDKKENSEIDEFIDKIDPLNTTPIEAINLLYKLKEMKKK